MSAIALNSDGSVILPMHTVSGLEAVRVRVLVRMLSIRGEWLTDATHGLLTVEDFSARRSGAAWAALVRVQLNATPGVVRVVSCTATRVSGVVRVSAVVEGSEDGETGAVSVQGVRDPLNVSTPIAWFASVGTGRPSAMAWG